MDRETPAEHVAALLAPLATRAGLAPPEVVFDPGAWLPTAVLWRGPGPGAKVFVAGGLLGALAGEPDPDAALSGILAHEIGHLAVPPRRRRRLGRVASLTALAGVQMLAACVLIGLQHPASLAGLLENLPALMVASGGGVFLALAAFLLLRRDERSDENDADTYAVTLTGNPIALAGAFMATEHYRALTLRHARTAVHLEHEHLAPGSERVPDGAQLEALRERTRLVLGAPLPAPRLMREVAALEAMLFAPLKSADERPTLRDRLLATHPSTASRVRRLLGLA